MKTVVMEFEKGGKFEISLDPNAPLTCKAFIDQLPHIGSVLHGRFSGEEFFFKMPLAVGGENKVAPKAGSVSFNSDPKWQAVCIYYGPNIKVSSPCNLFGEVKGDLAELEKIGVRIWQQGEEKIWMKIL